MNNQSKQARLSAKLHDVKCRLQELELAMRNFDVIAGYRIAEILPRDPAAKHDGRLARWEEMRRRCNEWRNTPDHTQHGLQAFQLNAQALLAELEAQR